MINKIIKIKSGIDINSDQFKNYYNYLKENKIKSLFLDMAIEINSEVLSNPFCFEEKDYSEFKVDDISFVWLDDKIIGHTLTTIKKDRFSIPTSSGRFNHLDKDIFNIDGKLSYSKLEQNLLYGVDIEESMNRYLNSRVHGKMEEIGAIEYEKTIQK